MAKEKFSGWRVFVGVMLLLLVMYGTASTIGIFLSAVAVEWGLIGTQIGLNSTLASISVTSLTIVSGILSKKMSFKTSLIIGIACLAAYYLVYAMAPNIYVLYSAVVFRGFFFGFAGVPTLTSLVARWFKKYRAILLGIAIGASGIGTTMFNWIGGNLIGAFGWRQACIVYAIVQLAVGIVAVFFLIAEPEKLGQKPLGWQEEEPVSLNVSEQKTEEAAPVMSALKDVVPVKNFSFWILCLSVIFLASPTAVIVSTLPAIWTTGGVEVTTAANYITILTGIGAAMTFVSGVIIHKLGLKATLLVYALCFILYSVLQAILAGGGNYISPLLLPAVIANGIANPTRNIMGPNAAGCFGDHNHRQVTLFFQAASNVGSTILPVLFGALADSTGNYMIVFILCAVFAALGYVLFTVGHALTPLAVLQRKAKNNAKAA